jgi:hypothetical protein
MTKRYDIGKLVIVVLAFFSYMPQRALAQSSGDAADAAVGNCIDDYIATGRYFLIDLTTGHLDLENSSLRLITTCQTPVSAWINQCEKETGNSEGCTQGAMRITQMLLLDGWNHRSDLRKWRSRTSAAQPGSGVTSAAPTTQRARKEPAANPQQAEEAKPSAAQPDILNEPKPESVQNPNLPAQPPSIAELNRQAVALWNQKRYSDAIPLFNQTCNSGNLDSCYHLGLIYDFGQGVAQDFSRARDFYFKACNTGNQAACGNLSILTDYAPGSPECNSTTLALMVNRYRGSCNAGNGMSCDTLGHLYSYGCAVSRDAAEAKQLYSRACTVGNQQGCDRLKEMQ